jgi:alpha-glucosidase (family GH31 glycosyl hydrolase)
MARPLFFHFHDDPTSLKIDSQFLLGKSVLVSPVLAAGATVVNAYFPRGTWYNLFNYSQVVIHPGYGSYKNLSTPLDSTNVHVADGSILPLQGSALATKGARKTPFKLIVAFSLTPEKEAHDQAVGALYLDDGEDVVMDVEEGNATFIHFHASKTNGTYFEVWSSVQEGRFAMDNEFTLQTLVVLGTSSLPKSLKVNGIDAQESVQIKNLDQVSLEISQLNLQLGKSFIVQWTT